MKSTIGMLSLMMFVVVVSSNANAAVKALNFTIKNSASSISIAGLESVKLDVKANMDVACPISGSRGRFCLAVELLQAVYPKPQPGDTVSGTLTLDLNASAKAVVISFDTVSVDPAVIHDLETRAADYLFNTPYNAIVELTDPLTPQRAQDASDIGYVIPPIYINPSLPTTFVTVQTTLGSALLASDFDWIKRMDQGGPIGPE